jgi:protein TonB
MLSIEPAKQAAEPAFAVPAQVPAPAPIPPAPVAKAAVQPAPQPAAPAASGPDPGAVARFRLELMDLARRYKKYPRIAQDNNWEGRVELRIMIAEDGAIASLVVKKSAGRSVLDEEAQAMIRTAKSKVTIPPGLRGKAFTLEIPVDFSLKDEER